MRYLLILFLCSLPACTPLTKSGATPDGDELSWHSCRFRVLWPVDSKPDTHVDLFLAHAVIKPVLDNFENDIPYWRFHRRFARDITGHRFSFLFFTDSRTTERVRAGIGSSGLLGRAIEAGIIRSVSCEDVDYWSGTPVSAASDSNWSGPVQQHWPVYIMGVSALWLGLIDDLAGEPPARQIPLSDTLERYRNINNELTGIWQREGRHAFQHHLEAVFGYELLLTE